MNPAPQLHRLLLRASLAEPNTSQRQKGIEIRRWAGLRGAAFTANAQNKWAMRCAKHLPGDDTAISKKLAMRTAGRQRCEPDDCVRAVLNRSRRRMPAHPGSDPTRARGVDFYIAADFVERIRVAAFNAAFDKL